MIWIALVGIDLMLVVRCDRINVKSTMMCELGGLYHGSFMWTPFFLNLCSLNIWFVSYSGVYLSFLDASMRFGLYIIRKNICLIIYQKHTRIKLTLHIWLLNLRDLCDGHQTFWKIMIIYPLNWCLHIPTNLMPHIEVTWTLKIHYQISFALKTLNILSIKKIQDIDFVMQLGTLYPFTVVSRLFNKSLSNKIFIIKIYLQEMEYFTKFSCFLCKKNFDFFPNLSEYSRKSQDMLIKLQKTTMGQWHLSFARGYWELLCIMFLCRKHKWQYP